MRYAVKIVTRGWIEECYGISLVRDLPSVSGCIAVTFFKTQDIKDKLTELRKTFPPKTFDKQTLDEFMNDFPDDVVPAIIMEVWDGSVTTLVKNLAKTVEDAQKVFVRGNKDSASRRLFEEAKMSTLFVMWDIMMDISWALFQLHENGLIHADVKPRNLLFKRDTLRDGVSFRIVLTDFGSVTSIERVTLVDGSVVPQRGAFSLTGGTPGFISPEGHDYSDEKDVKNPDFVKTLKIIENRPRLMKPKRDTFSFSMTIAKFNFYFSAIEGGIFHESIASDLADLVSRGVSVAQKDRPDMGEFTSELGKMWYKLAMLLKHCRSL
jgi:serine/threonine protein kinase